MADVVNSTFENWLPGILKTIEESSFFALDFEFLGLPSSARDELEPTLFDDSDERYTKIVGSIRRYPPCQLGLACFKEIDGGSSYEVETFAIPLFKRLARTQVFSYSLSAMSFLSQNNFDFNKFVGEGVTYANRRELSDVKKEMLSGEIDLDLFEDGLEHRIQLLKINFQRIADNAMRQVPSSSSLRRSSAGIALPHPILIELVRGGEFIDTDTVDQSLHPPWDRLLSSIEAATVVYALSNEHRHIEFLISPCRKMLYCAEIPLIVRNSTSEEERISDLLDDLLKQISGVSEIIDAVVARKMPIVGHNSFLDLAYLHECFITDLPATYDEWKQSIRTHIPTVFDTKIMACSLKNKLNEYGVTDHSLKTLGTFFDSPSCGQVLPFPYPRFVEGHYSRNIFGAGEHFHNAAFDARVTGQVFIKMLYLYAYTKSAGKSDFSRLWQLRKLIFACKSELANRVPIPLIDYLHCFLPGPDPYGHRPSPIRVRKRREWPGIGRIDGRIGRVLERIGDFVAGLPKLTQSDVIPLRGELKREIGAFRVDVKLEGDGTILVATNTPKTFARVARFLSAHWKLRPIEENVVGEGVSWEELLMSAEELKKKRRQERKRRRTTTITEGDATGMEGRDETVGTIALWTAGVTASLFLVGSVVYFTARS